MAIDHIKRDAAGPDPLVRRGGAARKRIVTVGINRYLTWPTLNNAVQDAHGALAAFARLGFEPVAPPLLDADATGAALQHLAKDELRALGEDDSLVVFFAGHGYTATTSYPDGTVTKTGYLLPVDAEPHGGRIGSWLKLDAWLADLTQLPARHILVIVDACHSGIALSPVVRWRGEDRRTDSMEALRARRSRRIITSALDDQLAMDSGPVPGHSLFTGCLIEVLAGGLSRDGQRHVTGSELGLQVQKRVSTYPHSKQTPDFGALDLDNRGELILDLAPEAGPVEPPPPPPAPSVRPREAKGAHDLWSSTRTGEKPRTGTPSRPGGVEGIIVRRSSGQQPVVESPAQRTADPTPTATTPTPTTAVPTESAATPTTSTPVTAKPPEPPVTTTPPEPPVRPPVATSRRRGSVPDLAFTQALERHQQRRAHEPVISIVEAEPMTGVTGWASWAAATGRLTLVTSSTGLDTAIAAILDQVPWLRLLPAARARLAKTARLSLAEVDAALDGPAGEREGWIDDVTERDLHARVAGWLLSTLRQPWAHGPELSAAPVQGSDLLAILCELAAPMGVFLHHQEPTAGWLEHAIQTAHELAQLVPRCPIAIGAPSDLVNRVLQSHTDSTAFAKARHCKVPLAYRAPRPPDAEAELPKHALHAALAADPRTRGLFSIDVRVPIHDRDRAAVVDLVARDALLAVEIDDWYLFRDPQGYHRDRIKDVWLQRAGFFVMRFLAEDVDHRLDQVLDEIALGLAGRRASGSFTGECP